MLFSWIGSILFLIFIKTIICHNNQFPGQEPPLQGHHAGGQQQHQQQQQHQNMEQFGGQAAHDAEHIKEHLDGKIDPTSNMTPEQLQFHYFNMHDLDKNGKLDGIELIKAITHFHQENPGPQHKDTGVPPPLPSEIELEQMIDSILKEDDFNNDGFIDYGEFLKAQQQRDQAHRNANAPK
ncbi:Multiple coagulation factor deficiency protein 2 [Strongyloides ratti]|uniref:Multiple coagulation factor deficiency protein 2 n=1 Tax=Strongyloides ratti TaxID=34506 RepID=A0A090L0F8_STRRB|nr:Multiple coagulation factor deficiency protein 2 [Strongyloides ratti]CEF63166.1 Multiple coagulation factor deficiency protein 2 [Strongyloides ratti]